MSHVEKVLSRHYAHRDAILEACPPNQILPSMNLMKEVSASRGTIIRPVHQAYSTLAQYHTTTAQMETPLVPGIFDSPSTFIDFILPRVEGVIENVFLNVTVQTTLSGDDNITYAPHLLFFDRIELLTGSSVPDEIISTKEQFALWHSNSDRDDRLREGPSHGFGNRKTAAAAGGEHAYMDTGGDKDRPRYATSSSVHNHSFSIPLPCFLQYGVKIAPSLLSEEIRFRLYFRPKDSLVSTAGSATLSSLTLQNLDATIVHHDVPRSVKDQLARQYSSHHGVTYRVQTQVRSDHNFNAVGDGVEQSQLLQSHQGYCAGLLCWWSDDSARDQPDTPYPLDTFLPESIQLKDNQQREILQTNTCKSMNTHLYPYNGFLGTRDFGDNDGWLWVPFAANMGAALKNGVHTGGTLIDERDQLFFTGNSTTAAKGAMTLHICSFHYSTFHIRRGKISIKRLS
jgi:hypothetical protein